MLLDREFVDTEEVSVSRFRGGRTGGKAEMARDGEAVEGVWPVSSLQDVDIDVWIWRGLGTGVGVVVVVWDVLVGLWFLFRDI